MLRVELLERYCKEGEYSREWWENNMPKGTSIPLAYSYRRTNVLFDTIERIIEIEGNTKECIVRFYGGEDMVVLANFDELCIAFNDWENSNMEDDN